jgi:hypothetical protein
VPSGVFIQEEGFIHFPVFAENFELVVLTSYRSEFILAPLAKNPTDKDSFTVPEDASHDFTSRSVHIEFFLAW